MFRLSHHLKVLRAIVCSDPINMMAFFSSFQRAANFLFQNKAMLRLFWQSIASVNNLVTGGFAYAASASPIWIGIFQSIFESFSDTSRRAKLSLWLGPPSPKVFPTDEALFCFAAFLGFVRALPRAAFVELRGVSLKRLGTNGAVPCLHRWDHYLTQLQ
jgi:hypothetical protein